MCVCVCVHLLSWAAACIHRRTDGHRVALSIQLTVTLLCIEHLHRAASTFRSNQMCHRFLENMVLYMFHKKSNRRDEPVSWNGFTARYMICKGRCSTWLLARSRVDKRYTVGSNRSDSISLWLLQPQSTLKVTVTIPLLPASNVARFCNLWTSDLSTHKRCILHMHAPENRVSDSFCM